MNPLLDIDTRLLPTGLVIPSTPGGYVDQPQMVVNDDGSWTCVITTGAGHEGEGGQHIASALTHDRGQTWSSLVPIEPSTGPEASWAQLLRVPRTGRLYVFYTYNKLNQREVKTIDGGAFTRVDSLGSYAYRYSDDCGRSWSEQRYEIPMRQFKCDQDNAYQGKVMMFWGVAKPLIHRDEVILPATKIGAMGDVFFAHNQGVTFHSS
ncbi:MAG: sialidase family protein, partial [Phycisphaeraceae bacterium JB051]